MKEDCWHDRQAARRCQESAIQKEVRRIETVVEHFGHRVVVSSIVNLIKTSKGIINVDRVAFIAKHRDGKKLQITFEQAGGMDFEGDEADWLYAYFDEKTTDLKSYALAAGLKK